MSEATTASKKPDIPDEIRIFSHSTLFYYWPVWAVGFILALLTYFEGKVIAIVPDGTTAATVNVASDGRASMAYVPPKGVELDKDPTNNQIEDPHLRVTTRRGYGVLFTVVLLLVIVITNVPLRGMWSVLIIMLIVMLSIIFALAGWWDDILRNFKLLDIRINLGGYMTICLALFVLWLVTFLFFDRQIYMIFTPGQFKVCLEIGAGEKTYDTRGMTIEKQRGDLFRHWVLGLGSGDMIVRTSGADAHEFRLNNVLFVGKKLELIERMQRAAGGLTT